MVVGADGVQTGAASNRRIAIIGAGGAGACAALELADRGHEVVVFERREQALRQASFANEGKIHLGLIYAKDGRMRTAAWMIEGALQFEERLQRWIPFRAADVVSTPFYYCVHRGSLMSPDELAKHYERCGDIFRQRADETGRDYLGLGAGFEIERLSDRQAEAIADPRYVSAVFRTTEYAVDPRLVAAMLRRALADAPRVEVHLGHRVRGVEDVRGGWRLEIEHGGDVFHETFSDVVNAAWFERLPLDRPLGIVPPGEWSHRYKFGNRVAVSLNPDELPSCTMVQGPYGDVVNFVEHGMFLSWYPIGRTGMSSAEVPPAWHDAYSEAERYDVFERSHAELAKRCVPLRNVKIQREQVDPYGGVIYALGTTDVDDDHSELHNRYEIGIQSRGSYHTVDTGKYTLVPYWGVKIADRVERLA
ncbi:MAG: FAD-dependent oxidoreductase [Myxococcota bacterium]